MKISLKPLTPETWPDLEKVFGARGCSVARGCWCMYYRRPAKMPPPPAGVTRSQRARRDLRTLTRGPTPPGLIGYRGKEPVGWISLGPREDYAYLARSRVMAPVDEKPVWSIICFVVPSEFRGQGVAHELLAGAVAWARKRGAKVLEAYPVVEGESTWFGMASMFTAAGFEEVARRKPDRPVMRLELQLRNLRYSRAPGRGARSAHLSTAKESTMNAQATATASSKTGTSLDGRKFGGIVLECGKTSGDAETITFRNGRFHSSACDAYGYGEGTYTASANGDAVSFSVETESAKYGKLRWQGVIRGKRLDGTLTMLDGGKVVGEKWVVAGQL